MNMEYKITEILLPFRLTWKNRATADLIRAEQGNEGYAYFISMDDPETVLLVDRWKDQASLDAHHASSMMRTIIDLRKTYDLHLRAERLISDDAVIPDSDVRFINE